MFLGHLAGHIGSRITAESVRLVLTLSIVVRTEKMKDGMEKGTLIAYHLLESSMGAYIEWLVNEPMRLQIKIEYNDAHLVMLPTNTINPPAR